MGQCFDKNNKSIKYQQSALEHYQSSNRLMPILDKYCQDPTTINTYNFILNNIKVKLKGYSQQFIKRLKICKVRFDIANISTYESNTNKDINGKHIFKPEFQTSIQINEENLRKAYLEIFINDQENEILSNIQINLYDVATGPHHFDYDFQLNKTIGQKGALNGKISFDLKMAQIVVIQLQAEKVLCILQENLVKQAYRYSMKLVVLNSLQYHKTYTHTFLSEYSQIIINPAYIQQTQKETPANFLENSDLIEDNLESKSSKVLQRPQSLLGSPRKQGRGQNKTLFFNDHQAAVNFKELKWDDQNGVQLDIEVPINQIPASSLQFSFWGVNAEDVNKIFIVQSSNDDDQSIKKKNSRQTTMVAKNKNDDNTFDQGDQEDQILICETNINLNQIFKHLQDENFEVDDGGIRVYKYTVQVEKGLWNHGQQEGTMSCELNIKVPAYIYQPIVGVRTNKCIQQGSSVINESQIFVKEISELANYLRNITDSVYKLQSNIKTLNGLERMTLRETLNSNIHDIIEVLQLSHKESINSFYYKSQSELFKAQDIFLKLAHNLITTADSLDDSTRERYYLMLMLIMNRGELALNQMGFSEKTEKTSQTLLKQKLDVGLSYQNLLYTILKLVLEKLKQKAYSFNERIFIESFCARAFFQIPEFRNRFTSCLVQADDPVLVEWRGTYFSLDRDQDKNEYYNKDLTDLFDWETHFYSYLDKEKKGKDNRLILKEILDQSEWQKRFGKRGLAFFMFLREWCIHVDKNVVVKEHIPWQDIPGYRSLVKAFLIEVKKKELVDFSDAMKQAMFALLYNEGLLNVIIVLLFNKTHLYDSDSVIELFEILNEALQYIMKYNKKLPAQLDLQFFVRGISSVLTDCEHAFCLSKCIWMIYNNYTIFPIELKKEICDLIFPNLAPKLFMHWSQNVRLIFHHFMLFRIYHLHRSERSPDLDEGALLRQYQKVIRPKKQQSFFDSNRPQNQIMSDYIYMKYYRVIQIIEQAKQLQLNDSYQIEERSYYRTMQKKLIFKKFEQRKNRLKQINQQESNQNISMEKEKEKDGLIVFEEDDNILSPQQFVKQTPFENNQPKQPESLSTHAVPKNNEVTKKTKRLGIFDKNIQDNLNNVSTTQAQLKYILKACQEFEDLKIRYGKWKDLQMNKYDLKLQRDLDADIAEKFEVPIVNLQVPIDEREGNISNEDDW